MQKRKSQFVAKQGAPATGGSLLGSLPSDQNCPFCDLANRAWLKTPAAAAILDGFPVSNGHTLVIPKRHTASLFELPEAELLQVWSMVARARKILQTKYQPDGFNIGVNDGLAAGQTVSHAHIHIIPRRKGDVPDPRGGIRWVIPGKAKYW